MIMYRLMRVRIYKRIFEKKDTDRPSFGEADVFSSWLDLPLGSVRRKNPKGEKRKNNGSFIISRSAERKSAPFHSFISHSFPGADLYSASACNFFVNLHRCTFKSNVQE